MSDKNSRSFFVKLDSYLISQALSRRVELLSELIEALPGQQHLNSKPHFFLQSVGSYAKQFFGISSQVLHRLPDITLGESRQKLKRIEKIRFSSRIRPHDGSKLTQVNGKFFERLEAVYLYACKQCATLPVVAIL